MFHMLILVSNIVLSRFSSLVLQNFIFNQERQNDAHNASYYYLHFVVGSIFLQYFLLTSIRVSFEYYVSKLACVVGEKFLYFIHGSAFGCWRYFCILENCFKLLTHCRQFLLLLSSSLLSFVHS